MKWPSSFLLVFKQSYWLLICYISEQLGKKVKTFECKFVLSDIDSNSKGGEVMQLQSWHTVTKLTLIWGSSCALLYPKKKGDSYISVSYAKWQNIIRSESTVSHTSTNISISIQSHTSRSPKKPRHKQSKFTSLKLVLP